MQADDVTLRQQIVQLGHLARVAQRQLAHHIVKRHLHAQRFCQHRQLRADGAIADDAQRLAPDFVGVLGRLEPAATVGHGVLFGHAAQQQDSLCQHQFGHRAGVGIRGVEDGNAALAGGVQVHLVGADAKAAHGHQLVGVSEHFFGELRARANAHKVHVRNLALEFLVGQRAGDGFDLRVPSGTQHVHRRGVNTLQQ